MKTKSTKSKSKLTWIQFLLLSFSILFILSSCSSKAQVQKDADDYATVVELEEGTQESYSNTSGQERQHHAPQSEPVKQIPAQERTEIKKERHSRGRMKMAEESLADHAAPSVAYKSERKRKKSHSGAMHMIAPPSPAPQDVSYHNTEEYDKINENEFIFTSTDPRSTFSIDVDNASYSNVRRYINSNSLPPQNAVRIEELINYFDYGYKNPTGEHPFSIHTEVSQTPWNSQTQLVHIGIQGKRLDYENTKPSNLVFLIDASGSMRSRNKLPLLKHSLSRLLNTLSHKDRVAIVAYAGAAGLVLESTPANQKNRIMNALESLRAGGSTAGGQGIQLAYDVAKHYKIPGGNNRVILATDGDFNVGTSNTGSLVDLIKEKRKDDIYLTICGFGMGNYKDNRMEQISNAGNGNYFYIDSEKEAEKVFVKEMRANMFTIAKDVKIQIEFNPALVKAHRLIGYENRKLQHQDFNNDKKDAGELGAGHTVTALYEIVPANSEFKVDGADVDPLKYQKTKQRLYANSDELMTVKFRYKPIHSDKSTLITHPLKNQITPIANTSDAFRFSAGVAAYGMLLRKSQYAEKLNFHDVLSLADGTQMARGEYGNEFLQMVRQTQRMSGQNDAGVFPRFRN